MNIAEYELFYISHQQLSKKFSLFINFAKLIFSLKISFVIDPNIFKFSEHQKNKLFYHTLTIVELISFVLFLHHYLNKYKDHSENLPKI